MVRKAVSSKQVRAEAIAGYAVWAVAAAVALVSARDYAGGWNDGSRLATVECLVDYHTLAIDKSIFVDVPRIGFDPNRPFPYPLDDPNSFAGTKDKVLVGGRYYSHKPPIPSVLLAAEYFLWQKITGLTARDRCDEFCYWMTLGSAGVGYVAAVVSPFYLAGLLGLPLVRRLELAASLAFATVAVAYVRHVNDHIILLGVASGLTLVLARLAQAFSSKGDESGGGNSSLRALWPRLALTGCLAGLAYTIDQGAGPPLALAAGAVLAYRSRLNVKALTIFAMAAIPWVAAHHAINYSIGGTFAPIGSVPEYFAWPGSPFDRQNMTGVWNHPTPRDFLFYALRLLFAPGWGFLVHNLPLLLTLPGVFAIKRRRVAEWPEAAALAGWCLASGLLYAALSVNHSGTCLSVRWFVPLLAGGYFLLSVLLRDEPRYHLGFLALTGLGCVLGAMMWAAGPWLEPDSPNFRNVQAAGAACWIAWLIWAAWPRRSTGVGGAWTVTTKNQGNKENVNNAS
ncbi:MAG TPA: hypothetical protein VMV10_12380 [Pirellulales bacterium]|nr:hypothetical protein [Pirellulales bacterium]